MNAGEGFRVWTAVLDLLQGSGFRVDGFGVSFAHPKPKP